MLECPLWISVRNMYIIGVFLLCSTLRAQADDGDPKKKKTTHRPAPKSQHTRPPPFSIPSNPPAPSELVVSRHWGQGTRHPSARQRGSPHTAAAPRTGEPFSSG
jgi:hypothetical protein